MDQPTYTYARRGNLWAVLKWQYFRNGSATTPLCYFLDKEDAMRVVRELNGKGETC